MASAGKGAARRDHQHEAVLAKRKPLEMVRQRVVGGKADIGRAAGDRLRDVGALALLDRQADVRMRAQKRRQRLRQMFGKPDGVGEQRDAGFQAARVTAEIAAHRLDILQHDAGVAEQRFAGRGQHDAAPATRQKRHAERRFQRLDPRTRRRQRQMRTGRAMRDAVRFRNGHEQLKIDQIEPHPRPLPSLKPKACSRTSRLCRPERSVNVRR